ncbi:hypothetical protein AK88_01238 [Plasmodium fragile]|uniref:Uncharacterized protein n=1 Tax=Plasmodium fragile TaxID=5857 RepID=A0A0D9QQV7_PLAFR|nr:uncharacterized protein AK88_01238 [Plasmodium fragile]KJP89152.1 hypothetical protein AK88_01238 [Plasmodium fragile]
MSAKLPPPLLKKGGPPLPKSVKPFVKPSFLLKHTGKLPAVLPKGKSEDTVEKEQNGQDSEDPPKTKTMEQKFKAMKPKIKVPELKFKPMGGKAKVMPPPPPKVTLFGGKAAALGAAQSEEVLLEGADPSLRAFKSIKSIKSIKSFKPGMLKFGKPPKAPKAKWNMSEVKLKGLGEDSEQNSSHVGWSAQPGVEGKGKVVEEEEGGKTELRRNESNDNDSLDGREETTGRISRMLHLSKYIDTGNLVNKLRGHGVNASLPMKTKGGKTTGSSPGGVGTGKNFPPPSFAKGMEKESHSFGKEENAEVMRKYSAHMSNEVTTGGVGTLQEVPQKSIPHKPPPPKGLPPKGLLQKGLLQKGLPPKGFLQKKIPPKGPPLSSPLNAPNGEETNRPADAHEDMHTNNTLTNVNGNNVMVGLSDVACGQTVGPVSTSKTSTLMQDTHYINAFSRMDGNYMGKVTGPPSSIDYLDKKPQQGDGQKGLEQVTQRERTPAGVFPPFVTPAGGLHNANVMPLYYYNTDVFQGGMGTGGSMFFPPGWYYVPMCTYGDSGWVQPSGGAAAGAGQLYGEQPTTNGEQTERKNKRTMKKKDKGGGRKQSDTLVAAGHLKPLQFRAGVEWSSEDEKYLNADVSMEEERRQRTKKNRKGQDKGADSSIGDSKWYEIERRLNNCRGVIQEREAEEEDEEEEEEEYEAENGVGCGYYIDCSDEEGADSCDDDTKYMDVMDSEYHYEGNTECGESEEWVEANGEYASRRGKNNLTKNTRRGKNSRAKNHLEEESYSVDYDNIYKNYKIGYLRERLKWANEYLRRGGGHTDPNHSNDSHNNPRQSSRGDHNAAHHNTPVKKHKERLDDIAHLFLPKNKRHENIFDLSLNFSNISESDKDDIIRMLFSCRELEKLIEEQHCVLDMLDNDLKEVNESLKLPPTWSNFNHFEILQESILNSENNQALPLNNTPFFIKGKVALIPKNLESFFDKPLVGEKVSQVADVADVAQVVPVADASASCAYSQPLDTPSSSKYMPKFAKAKVKPKVSLLLKKAA